MPDLHCSEHQTMSKAIIETAVKMETMQKDIEDLKSSSKHIGDTVIRIESSIEAFSMVSKNHSEQIKQNTDEIQKIKISDAVQTDNIGKLTAWVAKWGPVVAVISYLLLEKNKII